MCDITSGVECARPGAVIVIPIVEKITVFKLEEYVYLKMSTTTLREMNKDNVG
jgi:hypothetical protein